MDFINKTVDTIKKAVGIAEKIGNADLTFQLISALSLAVDAKRENNGSREPKVKRTT